MEEDISYLVEGEYVPKEGAADDYGEYGASPSAYIDQSIIQPSYLENAYADTYSAYDQGLDQATIDNIMMSLNLTEEAARVLLNDPENLKTIDDRFLTDKPAYLADPLQSDYQQVTFEGDYQNPEIPIPQPLKVHNDLSGMVKEFEAASINYEPYISPKVDDSYKKGTRFDPDEMAEQSFFQGGF